jgi:hypothetical protein
MVVRYVQTSVGQLLSFDPVLNQIINPDIKNLPTGYFFSFFKLLICNLTAWFIEFSKSNNLHE